MLMLIIIIFYTILLYERLGDEKVRIMMSGLFNRALEPYMNILESWLFRLV